MSIKKVKNQNIEIDVELKIAKKSSKALISIVPKDVKVFPVPG
jgi:hypothetical protein